MAYKNSLDQMFQNANIDIEKRRGQDPILNWVHNSDTQNAFMEYENLLMAIFTAKGTKPGDTFLQLGKVEFIQMMGEIGILIHPKKKTPEEEKKEKEARDKQAAGQQISPDQAALLAVQEVTLTEVEVAALI